MDGTTKQRRTVRPTRRGHATRWLGAIAATLLLAATLSGLSSTPSSAAILSSSVAVAADGTGQGTASGCQLQDGGVPVDTSATDGVVCTSDSVTFGWTFNADAGGIDAATMTQTLPEGWTWDAVSIAACEGNGTDYTGTATISPDGRTLTCVIDQAAGNSTSSIQIPVVANVGVGAANLSTYAAELTVTETGGTPQVSTAPPVTVRAAPQAELHKESESQGAIPGGHDFGSGLEPARQVTYIVYIDAPNAANGKGLEPLADPFTFVDQVAGLSNRAVLIGAFQQSSGSPSASQPGGPGTPVTLTVTGADTSTPLVGYPSASTLWFIRLRFAIPTSDIPPAPVGKDVINQITDFLPVGENGTPNNNGGTPDQGSEDGADCDPLVANNNCALIHLAGPGGGEGPTIGTGKSIHADSAADPCSTDAQDAYPGCPALPGETLQYHEDGYRTPGELLWARVSIQTPVDFDGNLQDVNHLTLCDKWDPALQQIDPNRPVKLGQGVTVPSSDYVVEYTNHVYADDGERANTTCGVHGDAVTGGPWFSSIAAAGGPSAVSGVRITWTKTVAFPGPTPPQYPDFLVANIPMVAGPIAGPVPDFMGYRVDETVTPSNPTGYVYGRRNGYRVTPAALAINKDTLPAGTVATAVGSTVQFTLEPSVNVPVNPDPADVTGLTVVDTLDPCLAFTGMDASVTDWTFAITTPADPGADGIACTQDAGEAGAVVTFTHIGPVTPNEPVQPIQYAVLVNALTPNNASLPNTAVVAAEGNNQSEPSRTDAWALSVAAPGAVRISKVADFPRVEIEPDDLAWTISWSNTILAPSTAGKTEWIDVLPYNGDGRGTSFSGSFGLQSVSLLGTATDVTVTYTDQAPAGIDRDVATNTSTWCTEAQFGTLGCPADMAAVTALRITNVDFVKGEVGGLHLVASPSGNVDGDLYINNVAVGHAANLAEPVPATPNSQIEVVASTIGDYVWMDADDDGVQDPDEDGIDGVTVNLFDAGGNLLETTTTAGGGAYAFSNLHSGGYRVAIDPTTLPPGVRATYDLDGGHATPDRDSGVFLLGADTDKDDVDFGEVQFGSISLAKTVIDPAPWDGNGDAATFPVTVECTGPGDAAPSTHNVDLNRDGTPVLIDELYVGAECTITETDTDGGTVTYSPGDTVTVTAPDDATQIAVMVTNVYADADRGEITVSKNIVDPDPGDDLGDAATFPVTVECTGPTGAPDTSEDIDIDRDGTPVVVDDLYVGATCTITETDTDGGIASYSPSDPVVVPATGGTAVEVTITNTYPDNRVASLVLSKTIVDPYLGDDLGDATTFPVTVECTGPTGAPDVSEDIDLHRDGTPVTVDDLYVGSTCTVTETDTDGGTATFNPGPVITIGDAAPITVVITNTFPEDTTTTTSTSTTTTTTEPPTSTTTTEPTSTTTEPPASTSTTEGTGVSDNDDQGNGTDGGTGWLPRTGSDARTPALIGLGLFTVGAIVLLLRRRVAQA